MFVSRVLTLITYTSSVDLFLNDLHNLNRVAIALLSLIDYKIVKYIYINEVSHEQIF
jgi:hypothetical protein